MTQLENFASFIDRELPIGSEVGTAEIEAVLDKLGITDLDSRLLAGAAFREWGHGADGLDYRPNGWRIQLSGKVAQTAVLSAILWGGLVACGITAGMSAAIASALIPSLFDIERVRLSRREDAVLAHLVLRDYAGTATPDEWYDQLPEEIRAELNRLDFYDVLDKIVASGRGRDEAGEVTIFRSGDGRFAITFE